MLASAVDSASDCRSTDLEFEPQPSHIIFMEIDLQIIPMAILPLLLIQERQLIKLHMEVMWLGWGSNLIPEFTVRLAADCASVQRKWQGRMAG